MTVLIAAAVCLSLAYLFLLCPRAKRKRGLRAFSCRYYAHRGLHGGNVCENTLRAFELGAESKYGLELDVRLTCDMQPVVFHDDTLERLCGRKERVSTLSYAELQHILLPDGQRIPHFREVLSLVRGQVPLLVEIKSVKIGDTAVSKAAWALLKDYDGEWAVQSFDPLQVRWFRKNTRQRATGQLAQAWRREEKGFSIGSLAHIAAGNLMFNCVSRPGFIAYRWEDIHKLSYRLMRMVFRVPLAVWTVRSKAEEEKVRGWCDAVIFENYLPENKEENQNERNA